MSDGQVAANSTSVEKALDILLCFSPEEPELGVSEIARRLSIGVSTAHRLLNLMMRKDFVRQNPSTSRYSLGFRVVHLVSKGRSCWPSCPNSKRNTLLPRHNESGRSRRSAWQR